MKAKFFLLTVAVAAVAVTFTSCTAMLAEGAKSGWTTSCSDAGWASIPISDRVNYDMLYEDIVSLISRKYEIEMLSKESGYIRTKMKSTVTSDGVVTKNYRSKITIKLSPQRGKIEINTEAEKLINEQWIQGCDTRLLEQVKQDLQGLSGY